MRTPKSQKIGGVFVDEENERGSGLSKKNTVTFIISLCCLFIYFILFLTLKINNLSHFTIDLHQQWRQFGTQSRFDEPEIIKSHFHKKLFDIQVVLQMSIVRTS